MDASPRFAGVVTSATMSHQLPGNLPLLPCVFRMAITHLRRSLMLRRWMLGGVGGMLLASVLCARPGVVKTRDGQTFQGDITEEQDQLVVDRTGIRTAVPRDTIQSVNYADSIEE